MNLIIDQGNTRTKAAVFEAERPVHTQSFEGEPTEREMAELFRQFPVQACLLSSVAGASEVLRAALLKKTKLFVEFVPETPVPLQNLYQSPETLGRDRLAAAVGANSLHPNRPLLIIDSGTAITFDFVNAQNQYLGGNISPGMETRFRALHQFTGKLPLVKFREPEDFLGTDTETAILSGVVQGIVLEMDGYISALKHKYSELLTFLTGGNAFCFEKRLKNRTFANENLVLTGLNRILLYNV